MSKSEPKIGKWKLTVFVRSETTGQYFTDWPSQKIANMIIPAGCGPYADNQIAAMAAAYRLIANVMAEDPEGL